jgi:hypothetical protein
MQAPGGSIRACYGAGDALVQERRPAPYEVKMVSGLQQAVAFGGSQDKTLEAAA